MKNSTWVIILLLIGTIGVIALKTNWFKSFGKHSTQSEDIVTSTDRFIDSMKRAVAVDSMVDETMRSTMFDTTGLSAAPIKVLKAYLYREEYSSYKSIAISYKNISGKRIDAVRFKWYGLNAFNEPADMGSMSIYSRGFGAGYDDDPIGPGKSTTSHWSILSRDGKKVVLAWPYEVVFSDGTNWHIK